MESEVGPDIGDLRALLEGKSFGNSNLDQIKLSIRTARQKIEEIQQLLQLLVAAQNDANRLDQVPTELYGRLSNLKKMKDNLIEAQFKVANLRGSKTTEHPEVRAAMLVEHEVRQQLLAELNSAITGFKSDLVINQNEISKLQNDKQLVEDRINSLGSQRAIYMNLDAAVKAQTKTSAKKPRSSAMRKQLLLRHSTRANSLSRIVLMPGLRQLDRHD